MGNKHLVRPGSRNWFMLLAGAALLLTGCATPPTPLTGEAAPPVIQSVKVSPSLDRTVVLVGSTRPATYTAFKLMEPPRVILDIEGRPGKDLPRSIPVTSGNVKNITLEEVNAEPPLTRMVIALVLPLEHDVAAMDEQIQVVLSAKKPALPAAAAETAPVPSPKSVEAAPPPVEPQDPRIFFDGKGSGVNQVQGIDFTMLPQGKSRVTITTDRKVEYDLDRKGVKTITLKLPKTAIPPAILREIDPSEFPGVVERIRPAYSPAEKQVSVTILLKEMVPFHVDQGGKGIRIDFAPGSMQPLDKPLVPVQLAPPPAAGARPPAAESKAPWVPERQPLDPLLGTVPKPYRGVPMTMDFVNADVTNILRLIGEISNLNIVWGPEVRGTVSMRLKNVPWDQALDLVLDNNNLAKREEGNVIWVTTKAQMNQFEAEEKRKREDRDREVDERLKRERVEKKEELSTVYLTVNYKDVNNIRDIIDRTVRSQDGKITVDTQTKTIIYYDRVSKLAEAKSLKERLDQPTPQVMIEARIIEANTSFSRNIGVQWGGEMQIRRRETVPWNRTPAWAVDNVPGNYPPGTKLYNPSFNTGFSGNAFPAANLGFSFAKLSRGLLTGTQLDAYLALSESEGKTRTLSAPKIVTRDTVKATIQQGTKIVIPSGTDANGNKTYQQVDASLKLEVTPLITPNNMVIMTVVVKDDQPDYANAMGENVPINTKEANTSMMVASGETVVIGGIYKETDGRNEEGIPGLNKIPLLGWLFKAQTNSNRRVELLIFITPTVMTL